MKPNSSFPLYAGTLLLAVVTLSGCHKTTNAVSADSGDPKVDSGRIVFPVNSPQLTALVVTPVTRCADCRLRLNGKLAWDDDVTVRVFSPFGGRIIHVEASPGTRVERDAPLAFIASPDYGQAQTDARKASTDLALAERNAERLRELAQHGAAAAKDVVAAEADLARAQSDGRRTSARLELYGATTDAIDNRYVLKCPIAGVVVEKNLNAGQEVRPDQMLAGIERLAAPLFVVTDPSKLWLLLDVTEADAAKIEVGQMLEVRVPTHPDQVFRAVLDYESDALDPMTRTVRARAVIDNTDRQLKAEQLVNVEIPSANLSKLVDVPVAAVFFNHDRHFVFAESGSASFVRREVRVGAAHEGQVQILSGLKVGDRVVTDGVMLLEQIWDSVPAERAEASAVSPPTFVPATIRASGPNT